jgi:hypothetical protein
MSVREPAVAGMFYKGGAAELRREIESCFLSPGGPGHLPRPVEQGPTHVIGLVSPHAGYMYSGSVAAWAYDALAEDGLPEIAVVLGPNHRAYFPAAALSDESAWRTPLGDVELDAAVTAEIASAYPAATVESAAHYAEHSIEVQAPFLQYLFQAAGVGIRIVPILIGAFAGTSAPGGEGEAVSELGRAIAGALRDRRAVLIASTDFTHYESSDVALRKDSQAISRILALDPQGLLDTVHALNISMCGVLPTAIVIAACKHLGAGSARRLAYRNSGDVTGDYSEVVGYAALDIRR